MTDTHDTAILAFRSFITDRFGLKSIRIADAALLAGHLQARAELLGLPSLEAYVTRLREGVLAESEEDWWAHALTINETYFFRNERDWTALRTTLLPEAMRNARGGSLQVLSLGCASGEEAWSMAMLLVQNFPRMIDEQHPILAGDIDRLQLAVASAGGPYSARSVRLVPPAYRERFLTGSDNRWYLQEDLKKLVRFQHLNIQRLDALRGRLFDLIFCRNVLIYFEEHAVQSVLTSLVRMLAPGGSVILGHSEGMLADMAGLPLRIVDGCLTIPAVKSAQHHAVGASPMNGDARRAHGDTLRAYGDPRRVDGEVKRVNGEVHGAQSRNASAGDPVWQPVGELTSRARALLHAGETEEAGRMLRLVLQRDAGIAEAQYLQGMLHLSMGRLAAALASFQEVVRIDQTHLMAGLQVVVLLGRTGSVAQAEVQRARLAALVASRSDDEVIDDEQGITIGFIKLVCATTGQTSAVS